MRGEPPGAFPNRPRRCWSCSGGLEHGPPDETSRAASPAAHERGRRRGAKSAVGSPIMRSASQGEFITAPHPSFCSRAPLLARGRTQGEGSGHPSLLAAQQPGATGRRRRVFTNNRPPRNLARTSAPLHVARFTVASQHFRPARHGAHCAVA